MTATVHAPSGALPAREAVMAQAGAENFPVASLALGRAYRDDLLAIYGFARLVDDTGDEAPGDRPALLDALSAQLAAVYAGGSPEHEIMRALSLTVRRRRLPAEPFERLIEANRRDQTVTRYASFGELLDYCRLSAAPVGELVLHVFGAASPARIALSDRVCAALQVIEHMQDVGEDYARGRIYLPADDLARAGCAERDLAGATASPGLRAVIAEQARRSHQLLRAGTPLMRGLALRPRLAIAGFTAGGRATLEAIEEARYDVLGQRPRRTRGGFARALAQVVAGR